MNGLAYAIVADPYWSCMGDDGARRVRALYPRSTSEPEARDVAMS